MHRSAAGRPGKQDRAPKAPAAATAVPAAAPAGDAQLEEVLELEVSFAKLAGSLKAVGGSGSLFWRLVAEQASGDTFWLDRSASCLAHAASAASLLQSCRRLK